MRLSLTQVRRQDNVEYNESIRMSVKMLWPMLNLRSTCTYPGKKPI